MDMVTLPRKLWEHENPKETQMWQFMQRVNGKRGLKMDSFQDLNNYSVGKRRLDFWEDMWESAGIIHEGKYEYVTDPSIRMDAIPPWFPGIRLNWAENLLYTASASSPSKQSTAGKEDSKPACTEVREGCTEIRTITWGTLREKVGLLSNAMRAHGVKKGDRVAVVASNSVDTLVVFLAVTALGGLFSSSSCDMGVKGILDRLLQIEPRWLFMDEGALYNGKVIDLREKMKDVIAGMKDVQEFQGLVTLPRWKEPVDVSGLPRVQTLQKYLEAGKGDAELRFNRVNFGDPFLVVYSSGTTGQPKCIVHSTGGILLNGAKEGKLHSGLNPDSVTLQYTTTGWIMYLGSILTLQHGARIVLYDGSPFQPEPKAFIKLVGEQRVTNLGLSPRYFHTLQTASIAPRDVTDLSALKACTSTGMVLSDPLFEWFYDVGFPPHVQLCNISGGTDLAGCFGLGNPLTPVYVGGCQGPSLGNKVEVYNSEMEGGKGVTGRPLKLGEAGELVATEPFPNMPAMFWGKDGAQRYFDAYFAHFDNVWTHGDFIQIHPLTGGIIFLGRADGVLNPSGVRFGSAEIYSVIEACFPQVADSICVGQRRPRDPDESVMLFLLMKEGKQFSEELVREVKKMIKEKCSARHVPKYIFETKEIPTTVNLKKVELPVKQIVSGKVIKPSGTLLNPESLNYYYQFAKVEDLLPPKSKL